MADKKKWGFGSKKNPKDVEQPDIAINNVTAEMLNISLGVTDLTASKLNLSLGINDVTNVSENDDKSKVLNKQVKSYDINTDVNVVQLDIENLVSGMETPSNDDTESIEDAEVPVNEDTSDTKPESVQKVEEVDRDNKEVSKESPKVQEVSTEVKEELSKDDDTIEKILNDIPKISNDVSNSETNKTNDVTSKKTLKSNNEDKTLEKPKKIESPVETPVVDDSEEYNYVPPEFRYAPEFTDIILIDEVTYKIEKDCGEIDGLRTYIVGNNGMHYKFLWYSLKRFKNYDLAKQTLEYITEDFQIKKIIFVPNKIYQSDSGFGYITNISASHYHSFYDVITNKSKFAKLSSMESTAVNLITLFESLSNFGLHLYNFNEHNLLINIHTGDVYMDIVSTFTKSYSLRYPVSYEYLAPETNIYNMITEESTRYSLLVILFRLLYHDHPLDGYNVVNDVNIVTHKQWYSEKAVFNMSTLNTSNHAVRGVHYQILGLWNKYPNYIKLTFKNFFENNLHKPLDRISYEDILLVFKHLKIMTVVCKCGYSDFLKNLPFKDNAFKCKKCGSNVGYIFFDFTKRCIPIKVNSQIYLSFVSKKYDKDDIIGIIELNPDDENSYVLKNLTEIPWNYSNRGGNDRIIKSNEFAILSDNAIIDIGYTRILVNNTKI